MVNLIVNYRQFEEKSLSAQKNAAAALVGKTKMFSVRGGAEGAIGYRL